MSEKEYEEMLAKTQAATLINASIEEFDGGVEPIDGEMFFATMREIVDKNS